MDPFRLTFLLLLAGVVSVRLFWHVRARIHERGVAEPSEGRATPLIRALVLPTWLALIVPWFVAPERIAWMLLPLPDAARWAGAAVVVAGLALLTWVHVALDRNFSPKLRIRADHTMVVHGPYRWVRHPMYTAFLALMAGFFLLSGHVLLGATGLGMVIVILRTRTPREEAMLIDRFGDAYRAYMARTGALLPRLV